MNLNLKYGDNHKLIEIINENEFIKKLEENEIRKYINIFKWDFETFLNFLDVI